MKLLLSKQSQDELEDAVGYYNSHKVKLGDEFKALVNESLQNIRCTPFLYPVYRKPIRRVVLSRFPYTIFYFIDEVDAIVLIVSIAQQRKKPFYTVQSQSL